MESKRHSHALASAAFVLAIFSLLSLMMIYLAIPLGALAILLSLLSRGDAPLQRRQKTTILLSLCAMLLSTAITGFAFYRIWSDPDLKARFTQFFQYYREYYLGEDGEGFLSDLEDLSPGAPAVVDPGVPAAPYLPPAISGGNFT